MLGPDQPIALPDLYWMGEYILACMLKRSGIIVALHVGACQNLTLRPDQIFPILRHRPTPLRCRFLRCNDAEWSQEEALIIS
jgi:hypothetical protein